MFGVNSCTVPGGVPTHDEYSDSESFFQLRLLSQFRMQENLIHEEKIKRCELDDFIAL